MRNGAITSKNWLTSFSKPKGTQEPERTCVWPLPAQGIDLMLLVTVGSMVLFGLLMVYSASFIYAQERTGDGFLFIKKQFLFSILGFLSLLVVCRLDYRKWGSWGYPVLGIATVLLALVMIPGMGNRMGGAQRWLRLGFLGFQPGEFAKFALVVFVAQQLDRKQERLGGFTAGLLSQFLIPLPALILLLAQPDFGSTALIIIVIFALMFLAGVPKKYLLITLGLALLVGAYLALGTPYRRMRVQTFLNPWNDPSGKGFQILQSFIGLHNGHIWGVGLGNGKEKLFYLPEAHNDFIFAVIGEELGFLGILGVVFSQVRRPVWAFLGQWDHPDFRSPRICEHVSGFGISPDQRPYVTVY